MKNWKTTTIGVLTIVAAVSGAALNYMQDGAWPNNATITAVLVGIGLISARDSKTTDLTPTQQVALKSSLPVK